MKASMSLDTGRADQHGSHIHHGSHIEEVNVEHLHGDALGIGTATPRISWVYDSSIDSIADRRATVRIRRGRPGLSWQERTFRVRADGNVLMDWPDDPLAFGEQARIAVALDDPSGNEDPSGSDDLPGSDDPSGNDDPSGIGEHAWSDEIVVEPGMLGPADRKAAMIGPGWYEPTSDWRHAPLLRTETSLDDRPVAARLYLSALGLVEAEINGHRVGEDILTPGWTVYDHRVHYRTYDVTDLLKAGGNGIGLWLADGWYRGRIGFCGGSVNTYGDRLAAYVQLEMTFADGSTQTLVSNAYDGRWKAKRGPIVYSGLCEGERYDARLADAGFSSAGYDDSDWEPVTEVRFDPMLLEAPRMEPVRAIHTTGPRSIRNLGGGSFLLDFGQNCTQRLRLHMHGLKAGDEVTVHHAEVLEPDGELSLRPLRRGVQTDVYVADGHDEWWEPRFTIHGFRYARIDGWPGELDADDVVAVAYGTSMQRTGWLETSNAMVNRLHENVEWSMRSNFVSIPTDCPQRDERLGWTGDIALFAPTAAFLHDVEAILTDWMDDVAAETERWGTVPYYVPFVPLAEWRVPEAIAIWGDSVVVVPWALYMASGDAQTLREQYPLARRWVEEVRGYLADDGVWDRRPNLMYGQLGDWLDPTAPPDDAARAMTAKELVATAFFQHSVRLLAEMAAVLGDSAAEDDYRSLAEHIRRGFLSRFVLADGRMTSDTQCAYTLAITFDLLDEHDERRRAAGDRLAELVKGGGYTVGTGFAGTPYLLDALCATGHVDVAYRLFLSEQCPSWMYQVRMGGTTTWERWDSMRPDGSVNPGVMTSFNHYSLGSVADWMHRTIGGITPLEPGWTTFEVAPKPGDGIDSAHVTHRCPLGLIDVRWKVSDGAMTMALRVPAGGRAVVCVGGERREYEGGTYRLRFDVDPGFDSM
ncbi:alpha-L-rhamnosidase [Bifidobacterium simiarum]|uniref:alpha-L-rhamnosidase n=1 Tax=Bifidobacterium simiarum TaxID=2045441 RepID=UPI001BDD3EAC|nr:alpha-L-rhamnosidase [Bifidobacterium simiarum]MBT1167228.1 family 78 glycoside hydrolase catalytic domain [Bifidobacterium simiarum]